MDEREGCTIKLTVVARQEIRACFFKNKHLSKSPCKLFSEETCEDLKISTNERCGKVIYLFI